MKKNKLLLIGWDAADWKIIGPLIAKGQMPALKKLIDKGVYGNMSTMNPPYSPMLWSTVATGKTPDKHGVLGFIELHPEKQAIRPVTVTSRKSKALWNIFHHEGLKSNIVGWWPSFPAEPINGVVVSDKFQKNLKANLRNQDLPEGTVFPQKMAKELKELRFFPDEITEAHILPFIPKAAQLDMKDEPTKKRLNAFAKVLAENTSVHAAATRLMRTTEWDFMAVYYDMIDHFCHGFMKFHPPKLPQVPQKLYEYYNQVIVSAYRFQDMMLERMMDLADKNTSIIVMSDHGYESSTKRILKMPKYPAAPALEHRRFGMFVASGPGIKKNEKVYGLSLIDVAPTILHYYGLPIGKDMDGKPMLEIFEKPKKPKYIESWENVNGDFATHTSISGEDALSDQDTMEQLMELGYIEKPDAKIETAIFKTKCDIKHNLARVYMGKKDFENSKKILLELIEIKDEKIDLIPFYMDLMTISMEQEDFAKAEEYMLTLRSLDQKFKVNTSLVEAKILLSKGKINTAIQLLEQVEQKNTKSSAISLELGNVYFNIDKLPLALKAYEKGLTIEPDNAKLHNGMAKTYFQLEEYEEAADHALTSIELVRYFPEAHYMLGRCLEKLGDDENAKIAFETANMLQPKMYKAEQAIENIEFQSSNDSQESSPQVFDNEIVVVSGLPRSGTSLMMQMLVAGGIDPLIDEKRKADHSNPKGYFEYEPVKSLARDNSWLDKAQNRSVKIVAPLLKFLHPKYRYRILFMTRDLEEIITSQQVMLHKDIKTLPVTLFNSYKRELEKIKLFEKQHPNVSIKYVDYKEVIHHPEKMSIDIAKYLNKELNTKSMCNCVDKKLYRNRNV
ncbi:MULTISPECIES: alkaline phosphatase family protein [Mesonia]|uniref:Lipopolysaccharide assembly protein B n=1 Tax=Mesonia oceanica TaxID=2687242 RepID=A0AC61Y4R0_9FLAO|nr:MULTISPECIES: alkaline phosphatase family protein [Mesonia]MAN26579.1 hypothetical protein [Mesonia sp.]MBJ97768.1 hypothetical protein [Flavobacteriaceae bacterium]VVU99476.1 Lipopolysaccharide assembly protein B [Mesonia oceanica]|tara:strand:- start:13937 stop:16468 length:2532 start_codon:yes stop_codon:yes gene_type:complete